MTEQAYHRTPFLSSPREEKTVKIYLKLPDGEEIGFERKPMEPEKFRLLCRLAAFGLYVVLTWVIVSADDFFALLWFFVLTAVLALGRCILQ